MLQHHDAQKVREIHTGHTLTTILPHIWKQVKKLLCQMLCICMLLLAVLGVGSWIEGMHTFTEAGLITSIGGVLAHALYGFIEED